MKVTKQTITNFSFAPTSEEVTSLNKVYDLCQAIIDTLEYAATDDRVIADGEQFNACDVLRTANTTMDDINKLFAVIDTSQLPTLSIDDDIGSILQELKTELEGIEEFD